MAELNCLTNCVAICCNKLPNLRITFDFSREEAQMFIARGVKLVPVEDGYQMLGGPCIFLDGNGCSLHGTDLQPQTCKDNLAGEHICMAVRRSYSGQKRLKEAGLLDKVD